MLAVRSPGLKYQANRCVYLIAIEARLALTLARDVMAAGLIVTITAAGTILTPEAIRTTMRADFTLRTNVERSKFNTHWTSLVFG